MTRDRQDRPRNAPFPDRLARAQATPDRPSPMAPGDLAPSGTPDTGRTVRKTCGDRGPVNGRTFAECQGSGSGIEGIADA